MDSIEMLDENDTWSLAKNCINALLISKDLEGVYFVGEEAESLRQSFEEDYASDDEKLKPGHPAIFSKRCRYLQGRLEETLKEWILLHPRTNMDIKKLLDGAKSFLTNEEWSILLPLEQHGLNEAASSILYNNFTSAEFIALRSVESLLRRWYEKKTNNSIGSVPWGQVIQRLDEEFPETKRPREISYLYFLKGRRDAVAHPEVISSENDAMLTFLQVIQACKILKEHLR